jgi:hypothetical protein
MNMAVRLSDVISQIESGNRLDAMRFESVDFEAWMNDSAMEQTYQERVQHANDMHAPCTQNTAAMICFTSWGAFQIMGFNLYNKALGLIPKSVTVGKYLNDYNTQRIAFTRFVSAGRFKEETFDFNDRAEVLRFAHYYNGPANADKYADLMRSIYTGLRSKIAPTPPPTQPPASTPTPTAAKTV